MAGRDYQIQIKLGTQRLLLKQGEEIKQEYPVSTALKGPGERLDSECTPRGRHVIAEKFGAGCAVNTVFVGRRCTGEHYTPTLGRAFPHRDWILTRILRLSGAEPGRNQGGDVDSYQRYIYIHGAPDEVEMGVPGSHGCIRMRNKQVMELFELVGIGTQVNIES